MTIEYPIPRLPQPLTEEGLRRLMRERPYWDLDHPRSGLYRRLVERGFAMLFPGNAKHDETGKMIDAKPLPPEAVAGRVAEANREMDRLERSLAGSSLVARQERDDETEGGFDERQRGGDENAVHVQAHTRDGGKTEVADYWRARPEQGSESESKRESDPGVKTETADGDDLPPMVNPVPGGRMRGDDGPPYGSGAFGASRIGRRHEGVDIEAQPGGTVVSPVSGKAFTGDPYGDDPKKRRIYQFVRIETDDGHMVKVFYVKPGEGIEDGAAVKAGQPIGTAQDLSRIYPPRGGGRMTNHVHMEVWKGNRRKDPTGVLFPEKR